jgi:hypothetical protein
MKVVNIHERELHAPLNKVGALIDSLSSPEDALWPDHLWPPIRFDRPLAVGATGGHGPVRYFVEAYTSGQCVQFRFVAPKGFNGFHSYECVRATDSTTVIRHTVRMTTHGLAILSWPLIFRPLHDALIEDSFATAEAALGQPARMQAWSLWVKLLRWILSGGKARPQVVPKVDENVSR